eukprot:4437521-Amphidinium_carterae.1
MAVYRISSVLHVPALGVSKCHQSCRQAGGLHSPSFSKLLLQRVVVHLVEWHPTRKDLLFKVPVSDLTDLSWRSGNLVVKSIYCLGILGHTKSGAGVPVLNCLLRLLYPLVAPHVATTGKCRTVFLTTMLTFGEKRSKLAFG